MWVLMLARPTTWLLELALSCKLRLIAKGRGEEERLRYQVRFEKGWKVNEVGRSRQAVPNGRV